MDSLNSLVKFFYNIIPGIYFLSILVIGIFKIEQIDYFIKKLPTSENIYLYVFVILLIASLLLGFIFQGFTKIIRELFLDTFIIKRVCMDNQIIFNKSIKIVKNKNLFSSKRLNLDKKNILYLMDNYLNVNNKNKLPTHFSDRTSFWFNFFWANIVLSLIFNRLFDLRHIIEFLIPSIYLYSDSRILTLTLLIGLPLVLALRNMYGLYDSIMKSFIVCFLHQK